MPLAGSYTWKETPETLVLVIPLKGASYKQTDVFLAETIVKVSYAPFLLDLTLFKSIEYNEGTAIKKDGKLYLELVKKDKGIIWGGLLFDGTPQEIDDRRRTALESRIVMVRDRHEAARKYKWEEEQLAVRKQIELETLERQRIEKLKVQEKDEEALQLFRAVELLESQNKNRPMGITTTAQEQNKEVARKNKQIALPCTAESSAAPILAPPRMPKPRSKKVVTIQLTPRIFNTPMRESTFKNEQAFIVKNRPFLKTNRLLNNNTHNYNDDLAESNSVWLKAKGDEFYKRKDYSSAVNAYTRAFEQSSTNLMTIKVIANRAACYLQLGESYRCAADCEYVMNMMKNNVEASVLFPNQEDALILEQKILSRLASAQCQLGNFLLALDLLKRQSLGLKANKLSHDLTLVLQQDMELVSLWYQSSLHKLKADEKLSNGYCEEALQLYNEALLLNPFSVSALANRAACYMVQKEFSLCIDDCITAAEILETNLSQTSAAPFPIHSCSKRLEWIITIRLRQCAAKELNKDFNGALSDVESIIALIDNRPSFTTVKRELEKKRIDLFRPQQ